MTYLDLAAALVKRLEACKLTGYLDSVGKPTNGYGHTGPEVRVGQAITQEIADHNLDVDLATADARLTAVCGEEALTYLDQHEHAALVSFVFNVGAGTAWQIWKDIKKDELADVPTQLRRFINGKVNGKEQVILGLEHRREAEIAYWNTADVEQAAAIIAAAPVAAPPSSFTRDIVTPPTPTPAPPMATASLVAKSVTVVGGTAAWIGSNAQQVHDVVAPYSDTHPFFKTLTTISIAGIVGAGIVGVLIHAEQAHARKT